MQISALNHTVPPPVQKPMKGSSLFLLGAMLGVLLLLGLNAGQEFIPGWIRSIFVPPPLLRLMDGALSWIPARFCAMLSPESGQEFLDACTRAIANGLSQAYAGASAYVLVATYYGLIVWILVRGYSFSKARTQW